ncbi:Uncharacterised protein [Kingella potus]|uniref:Uncharacterized protein n=1 Tax=Kingella potus TaxID=265175 RepID=A0A377R010_9NEIS|nr:Uncharacterised protein [Kingella potus]
MAQPRTRLRRLHGFCAAAGNACVARATHPTRDYAGCGRTNRKGRLKPEKPAAKPAPSPAPARGGLGRGWRFAKPLSRPPAQPKRQQPPPQPSPAGGGGSKGRLKMVFQTAFTCIADAACAVLRRTRIPSFGKNVDLLQAETRASLWRHTLRHYRARGLGFQTAAAARRNAAIFAASFTPAALSTPPDTSTAAAPDSRTAAATLSGVSPPASTHGLSV